ncbi:XRE family transcriptional regulator [Sporolactobacillus shoreae]|uniref:XRE family transcriptional regulator n=1 Tax=Sporolactobacillus shoreae TaxID=1465501 RepID=A0A4Z0GPT2_9BACL|nr:helix-turn-helix transcriptional regulator [Sporolactobacillus shoreae]TGA98278.1 XRE family transcriptional regulator [Sporolactobacillus shoreae]
MAAIGELIRKIRMDKGMTQSETSKGILSRSHLSELEHNNYYPTYDKMILLINRLGLSLEEFEDELHQKEFYFEDYYIKRTNDLSTRSKIDELATFLENEFTEEIASRSLRLYHKRLNMLGLVDYVQHKGQVNSDLYQPIFNYLLKCQNWRSYEVTLLSNAIFLAEYFVAKVLAKQFLTKFHNDWNHSVAHKIPVFFNNLSEMALMNQEPNNALNYCAISRSYTVKNHDLYNQLIGNITAHMANCILLIGKEDEIVKDLQLFIHLGYEDTADYYHNLCAELKINLNWRLRAI